MKFTTPILVLLSASCALSHPFKKRGMLPGIEDPCQEEALKDFNDCLQMAGYLPSEESCAKFKSDKCVNLLSDINNVKSAVSKCTPLTDEQVEIFNKSLQFFKERMTVTCDTVDENNKLCPILAESTDTPESRSKGVNDTCKSEICTKKSLELLRHNLGTEGEKQYDGVTFNKDFNIEEAGEGDNDFYVIAFLKSDYCASKHEKAATSTNNNASSNTNTTTNANTNANASSDATSIRRGTAIFTILSLLYTLL